jgi:glycosyltransferase involved in cell wall biosynthesis
MNLKKNQIRLIFFLPFWGVGGASESVYKLVNFLIKKKFSILIISTGKNLYKKKFKKINCDIIEINCNRSILSIFKLRKILLIEIKKNFKKNILISNFHYANVISMIASYKIENLKVLLTERSSVSELEYYDNYFQFLKNKIIYYMAKWLYKESYLVIANSNFEKNYIAKKFKIKNIKCIHPPSIEKIITLKNHIKKRNTIFKIIYVGRLSKEKGLQIILNSLSKLKKFNFTLDIYGDGPQKLKIKELINLLKLNKNIKLRGHIENKNTIYKNADLFINASIFEGLPNALVQSINYGVFPICSNAPGGNLEVIKYGKLGLSFKMNNEKDLRNKIIKCFQNNLKLNYFLRKKHLVNYTEKKSFLNYYKIFTKI